jgi:hypothetical protein
MISDALRILQNANASVSWDDLIFAGFRLRRTPSPRNRPGAGVLVAPEWPAGVDEQNLDGSSVRRYIRMPALEAGTPSGLSGSNRQITATATAIATELQ